MDGCPAPQTGAHSLASPGQGEIAQLVEHTTENRGVPGSSPGLAIVAAAGLEPGTTARQSLATGSRPGPPTADPAFVATCAEPFRLIAASHYVRPDVRGFTRSG